MEYGDLTRLSSEALMLCVVLSLPAVLVSAVVGLLVSFFQAITSLQDSSISQGIKLLAVAVIVMITAPWAGGTILRYSENIMGAIFR